MSDAPQLATRADGSAPMQPVPLRTESVRVRLTRDESVTLRTHAHAAGVGTSTFMRLRSLQGLGRATRNREHQ
jgi:hypothetical protein